MGKLYLGTSGWSYRDWVGVFYRGETRWFSEYSQVFHTTEINSTFYRYPPASFAPGLVKTAPVGFIFSAKIPKVITHEKRLDLEQGVESDLRRFLTLMEPLESEGMLGPLLIQLPPVSKEELVNFERFLKVLPVEDYQFVAEFRDESWMNLEVFQMLREHKVGYCIVDEPLLPAILEVTSEIGYIRWHGHGGRPWYYYHYSEEELKNWVPKILELKDKTKALYAYFNNHFKGYAPKNALQMLQLLGEANETQRAALERIIEYFTTKAVEVRKEEALAAVEREEVSVNDLLVVFLGERRLERVKEIKESELKIQKVSEDRIEARIRDYYAVVDLSEKALAHNCEDWKKRLETKQFCKHLGKLFLSLPKEKAIEILKDISENLDEWSFEGMS